MNRNNMPLILMLVAGAVTCIITFLNSYTISQRLLILFIVLLVFYILGTIMKSTLNYFDRLNEKRSKEAGEVIEKDTETEKKSDKETEAEAKTEN
jgi:phosphotransferase system  glucose/maltose/N-acetylglucosamine-specific IIC component